MDCSNLYIFQVYILLSSQFVRIFGVVIMHAYRKVKKYEGGAGPFHESFDRNSLVSKNINYLHWLIGLQICNIDRGTVVLRYSVNCLVAF